jgi:hypothetical protein
MSGVRLLVSAGPSMLLRLMPALPLVCALVGLLCTELVGETRPYEPPFVVAAVEVAGAGVLADGYGGGRVAESGVTGD